MTETLIITSINGRVLTEKLLELWFDANEIFITKTNFSDDRYSVEVTFTDEERADIMSDLLSTCYGDSISISRPQVSTSSLNNSFEEERVPSPVHMSSASSISSKVSCFSQRLATSNKKVDGDHTKVGAGRGRGAQQCPEKEINDEDEQSTIIGDTTPPTPSTVNHSMGSVFGRGRGSVLK